MKRLVYSIACAFLCTFCGPYVQDAVAQTYEADLRSTNHEMRAQRRAERLAEYEKMIDSLVLSRNFQFNPTTMQRQPAGPMRQIMNPEFEVSIWDTAGDICLPYIKGYTPPYYVTILNYTLPTLDHYTVEQTHEGWMVSFSSSLFSGSTYTFTFEIYSRTGGATLTISNPWYSDVQYTGTLSQLY